MVSEKRKEKRGPRAPSPRRLPTYTELREPTQGPERQSLKGLGLRHLLESRARHSLGTVATTGLSPLPEQAQDLIADPPAHWGCSSSASGTDRAYDAKLLPTVALCTQSMDQRGTSHKVTCKDIPRTSKGFVVLIPKFQRPFEGSYFMWTEVDP